jgi:SagB-type dehydrogenase family enzyme
VLRNLAGCADGVEAASTWLYALRALERTGLIRYSVVSKQRALARLVPISPYYASEIRPVNEQWRLTLSRFALLRRARNGPCWLLESPLALARLELLHPTAMTWLAALAAPVTAHALLRDTPRDERAARRAFLALLFSAGFLTSARESASEEGSSDLALWEFADALMHARSRRGRHDNPFGRTFPFRGKRQPLPRVKARMSRDTIPLARPDLETTAQSDATFTRVLETRRSLRAHGRRPIRLRQLAEFLYRAARIQTTLDPDRRVRPYDASLRPSPGGGACHELEIYPVVNRCEGLPRGVYHYDPLHHTLERLASDDTVVGDLIDDCPRPENAALPWHVLLIITARFGRVSWKYRGMSYATVLKDVGALMQTMYLVATAMELAPCALGGGDAERFARVIGSDYFSETSVGEFLIGTRAAAAWKRHR